MSQNSAHSQRVSQVSAEYAAAVLSDVDSRLLSDRLAPSPPDAARSLAQRTARLSSASAARVAPNPSRMAVASAVERNAPGVREIDKDADEEVVDEMFIIPLSELPWVKSDPVRQPMFQPIRGGKLSFTQLWTQAVSNWHGSNRMSSRRANRAADMLNLGEVRRSRP